MTLRFFLVPLLLFCISEISPAQSSRYLEVYTSRFAVKPAVAGEYNTPQKYGAGVGLYLGKFTRRTTLDQDGKPAPVGPPRSAFKGVGFEAHYARGGYRFSAKYFELFSFIGAGGIAVGPVYYSNNSFSSVVKRTDLVGVEADLYLTFKAKAGVLKDLNSNRLIPTLGIGIPIGPKMYD